MIINSSSDKPFIDVDVVGIAISRNHQHNQNHIAILYKYDDIEAEPLILHVATHHKFLKELPDSRYLWLDLSGDFDSIDRAIICGHVQKIADANSIDSIQYGLDVNSKFIDSETGKFKSTMNNIGLTCGTFILEVFESCGFKLINWDSWPKNQKSDIKWQKKIIELVFSRLPDVPKDYLERQSKNIGNARFLPEEVAASTQLEIPVNKAKVKKPALDIRKALIKHST